MRRGVSTVVVVATLGVITASLATASPGSSSTTQVINLISTSTPINDFVDLGPAGFSPGDLYVFSDRLFPVSTPDEQVGTSDGRCPDRSGDVQVRLLDHREAPRR